MESDGGSRPESRERDEGGNTAGSRYEGGASERRAQRGFRGILARHTVVGLDGGERKRAREHGGAAEKSSGP